MVRRVIEEKYVERVVVEEGRNKIPRNRVALGIKINLKALRIKGGTAFASNYVSTPFLRQRKHVV